MRLRMWYHPAAGVALARGLAWASLYAMIGTWLGLKFGAWMKTVQR